MQGGALEYSEVLAARRSVRTFDHRPVDRRDLDYVLQAACAAPSADNRQPTTFVVVDDPGLLATIGRPREVADGKWINRWLAKAPVIVVVCADRLGGTSHHGIELWHIDAAIAAEHVVLAATDIGLGACWVGAFDETAVRNALRIPPGTGILALLALGHPAKRMAVGERIARALTSSLNRNTSADSGAPA